MKYKTTNKRINDILKLANKNGWRFKQQKGGSHILCFSPNGKDIVTVSGSPGSDAIKKVRADFRGAGLKVK